MYSPKNIVFHPSTVYKMTGEVLLGEYSDLREGERGGERGR